MTVDRRTFLLATAGVLATHELAARSVVDRGLFWSATPPGNPASVLFGYARVSAAAAAAVVEDGRTFALRCGTLLADVPDISLPTASLDRKGVTPISDRVPLELAQRVSAYVGEHFAALPGRDRLLGLELVALLRGEGQSPPTPSVGGTIAESAVKSGRPLVYLLSQQDCTAAYHAPDLAALERRIDAETIEYLLNLRGSLGPLGKYQEELYAARRCGDLEQLANDMKVHGVPSPADLSGLPADRLGATIAEKAVTAVRNAGATSFLMLPIGTLTKVNGVLTRLSAAGIVVKPLA